MKYKKSSSILKYKKSSSILKVIAKARFKTGKLSLQGERRIAMHYID